MYFRQNEKKLNFGEFYCVVTVNRCLISSREFKTRRRGQRRLKNGFIFYLQFSFSPTNLVLLLSHFPLFLSL